MAQAKYSNSSIPTVKREGARVLRRNGYVYVKTRDGWQSEHRFAMSLKMDLEKCHRVVHLDNTLRGVDPDAYNDMSNLVVVKVRVTKWVPLKRSRILFEPPTLKPLPLLKAVAGR